VSIRGGVYLLLASAVAAIAFAEVSARLLEVHWRYVPKRPTPLYLRPNPYLFRSLIPSRRIEADSGGVVEVNSLGFRGEEISASKPPGTYRIVALGGSTTFGYHRSIKTTEETYPFKLEAELRRRLPGRKIEVINGGVPGYTLRTSLVNFVSRITWLQPDMIIVYHGINDVIMFRNENDVVRSVIDANIAAAYAIGALERVLHSSYLYLDLRYRIPRLRRKIEAFFERDAPASSPTATLRAVSDVPPPVTLAAYERNLRNLVIAARDAGTEVALVHQATVAPPDCSANAHPSDDPARAELESLMCIQLGRNFRHLTPLGIERTLDAFAEIERRTALEYGGIWIDADAAIPDDPEHHSDICHLWPAGTTLLARTIADGVVEKVAATD
jgi:lysophospholipase L1-like esterase